MSTMKSTALQRFVAVIFLALSLSFSASAQTVLQGKVTDSKGQPLPGVTILIAGTTNGAMTDLDGLYSIPVKKGETLEFSCLGLATVTI